MIDFSLSTGIEIISSLPLQMSLYFNVYFFPFWWLSTVVMLHLKVSREGKSRFAKVRCFRSDT